MARADKRKNNWSDAQANVARARALLARYDLDQPIPLTDSKEWEQLIKRIE